MRWYANKDMNVNSINGIFDNSNNSVLHEDSLCVSDTRQPRSMVVQYHTKLQQNIAEMNRCDNEPALATAEGFHLLRMLPRGCLQPRCDVLTATQLPTVPMNLQHQRRGQSAIDHNNNNNNNNINNNNINNNNNTTTTTTTTTTHTTESKLDRNTSPSTTMG